MDLKELRRHLVKEHRMRPEEARVLDRDTLESYHMHFASCPLAVEEWAAAQARHMRSSYPGVTKDTFIQAVAHLREGWRPRGIMDLMAAQYLALSDSAYKDEAALKARPEKPKDVSK